MSKREEDHRAAEGGFTENELRNTDYARSHVYDGHAAQLNHERSREENALEDALDFHAKVIEAGDRKSADLMRRASTHLQARWDKINDLRRMMREDGQRMRDLERDLRDARDALIKAREEIHTAEENLKTLRAIVAGGEIL
jgi:chromosome segregation ATPase